MLTLLTFGTLWFWLITALAVATITALVENGKNAFADIVFIGAMIAFFKLGCQAPLITIGTWILAHPILAILSFLAYLVAGTLYSMLKWGLYVLDGKQKLLREGSSASYWPSDWKPSNNKSMITHWMIYWPISGAWTLISNPVAKAFNKIFYRFEGVYQKISDKIMKEFIEKRNNQNK